jgi:hypothetical protein
MLEQKSGGSVGSGRRKGGAFEKAGWVLGCGKIGVDYGDPGLSNRPMFA